MTDSLVEIRDLRVSFVSREATVSAVNGVSFSLMPGEVLCIIGESGSGKSVTMRSLLRLHPPRRTLIRGSIRVDAYDILSLGDRAMNEVRGAVISMVFQEPMTALDPVYTIGEQIAKAVLRHEGGTRQRAHHRIWSRGGCAAAACPSLYARPARLDRAWPDPRCGDRGDPWQPARPACAATRLQLCPSLSLCDAGLSDRVSVIGRDRAWPHGLLLSDRGGTAGGARPCRRLTERRCRDEQAECPSTPPAIRRSPSPCVREGGWSARPPPVVRPAALHLIGC